MTNRIWEDRYPTLSKRYQCPLDGFWYFEKHLEKCEATHIKEA